MIVLGVTGGLASGKSTVSEYLKEKYKAYIFDADIEAKKLLHTEEVEKQILEIFPEIKSLENNTLSRIAFKTKKSQQKLNSIIHPHVEREIECRILEKQSSHPFFIIDAALIIESGSVSTLKNKGMTLLVVVADESLRIERAKLRGNLLVETILERIRLQLLDSEKLKHADFVIENNSTKAVLFKKVDKIITKIINE
ncbi:MAG: dephospho-CoA kinase [Candidatus Neomarinimicrobiota bacterium]|tara:strand:- start:6411 stop:7001 length:591 start_codon:yes stop_codon:yes gene_type:complete